MRHNLWGRRQRNGGESQLFGRLLNGRGSLLDGRGGVLRGRRQHTQLRAQSRYRPQIVGVRSGRQSAGIDVSHYLQDGVRFVFTAEWTEPQAIARASILRTLQLIHMRPLTAGDTLCGHIDRRGRRAEIDHKGSWTTEAGHFRQGREQVVNGEVPNFPGHWRICRRSHECLPQTVGSAVTIVAKQAW